VTGNINLRRQELPRLISRPTAQLAEATVSNRMLRKNLERRFIPLSYSCYRFEPKLTPRNLKRIPIEAKIKRLSIHNR